MNMEITLTAGDLATTLALVKGVVSKRETIPILNNVLLDAAGGQLTVTGSSLDAEVSVSETVEVVAPGRITVPGHALFGIAKSLPKAKLVTLKIDGARCLVTCGSSRYDLGTLPAEDFPALAGANDEGAVAVTLPAELLKAALSATRQAHSTDEKTRFYLCGTHVTSEDDRLAFVAIDGHRLVHIRTDIPLGREIPHVIVPSDTVQSILTIADRADGDITLAMSDGKIEVTAGAVRLISKLVAGQFPDYGRVIPNYDSDEPTFTAPADRIADALSRLSSVAKGIAPAARIATNGSAINLSIKGENHGSEAVDAAIGRKTEFGVNIKYLSEMLGLWPSGADLKFTAPTGSPILITSDAAPMQRQVIMPMKV